MYWLQLSLMRYVYSEVSVDSSITLLTGISLKSAQDERTLDIRRILLMAPMYTGWLSHSTPYVLQQTLFHSTLFFPAQWREFHSYIALKEYFYPNSILDALALETYWLELLLARGYAILYPNFDDAASFAVQHSESPTSQTKAETPLLQWGQLFEQIDQGLPDWEDLPVLNFDKSIVGWDQLERTSRKYQSQLSSCKDFPERGWKVIDLFCFPEEEGYQEHGGSIVDVDNRDEIAS
jgi:hypothetical protein